MLVMGNRLTLHNSVRLRLMCCPPQCGSCTISGLPRLFDYVVDMTHAITSAVVMAYSARLPPNGKRHVRMPVHAFAQPHDRRSLSMEILKDVRMRIGLVSWVFPNMLANSTTLQHVTVSNTGWSVAGESRKGFGTAVFSNPYP